MIDNSVKFAWAFLILYGKLTNGKWSYYGSCWQEVSRKNSSEASRIKDMDIIQAKSLKIGIDWEKSGIPKTVHQDVFSGTFASNHSQCLATLGKLVLLDGQTFLIGSSDDDAARLVETARAILNKKHSEVEKLSELLK